MYTNPNDRMLIVDQLFIEQALISQSNEEIQHWKDGLQRFLSIIKF